VESFPHPEIDFAGFVSAVRKANAHTAKVWDPVSKRMRSWVKKGSLYGMAPYAQVCNIS
jgi:hypothetical protein